MIEKKIGGLAWLLCFVIAIFGFWCGCCLIPFCFDITNDQEHRCEHCHEIVGYRRSL